MHVKLMAQCTRVKAPKNTIATDILTFQTYIVYDVIEWLEEHGIWDYELVAEDDGDHGPLFVYYFVKPEDAVMFSLRWA